MPRKRLIILTYHQVSKVFNPQFNHKNVWLSADIFEEQLKQFKTKYKVLSLPEAIKRLKQNKITETTFVLTFDDGDISVEHTIAPLLEKYKIPATFFINSAYLDTNKSYWFVLDYYIQNDENLKQKITPEYKTAIKNIRRTDSSKDYQQYREIIENFQSEIPNDIKFHVSFDFLKNLNKDLFTIGLHGHEHQRFPMMSDTWKTENLEKNINALKNLPVFYPAFAIPFGSPIDWDKKSLEIAKNYNLHFLLAGKGYNLKYTDVLLRDSVTQKSISDFLTGQSPSYKKYLSQNGIV
ncbi:MAG: polysaccharide deacetylase family protein [Chlorobi bacterium]|nr:polysaccharide deacetylase family protein [Chlorobiota bacterium]